MLLLQSTAIRGGSYFLNLVAVFVVFKLQALVYDILFQTTAITGHATGLEELSANGQFFAGAQTAVSL